MASIASSSSANRPTRAVASMTSSSDEPPWVARKVKSSPSPGPCLVRATNAEMQEQLPCRGFNLRGFLAQLGEGPGPLRVFLAYPGRSFARVAQLQGWTSLPLGRRYPQLIPSRCFFEFVSELQDSRDIYAHGSGNPFEVFLRVCRHRGSRLSESSLLTRRIVPRNATHALKLDIFTKDAAQTARRVDCPLSAQEQTPPIHAPTSLLTQGGNVRPSRILGTEISCPDKPKQLSGNPGGATARGC